MAAGPVTMPPSTMAPPPSTMAPPPPSTMAPPPPPKHHYPRRHHRRRRPPPRIRYIRRPPRIIRRPYPVPVPVTYEVQEEEGDLDCDIVKKIETEGEPTEFELKCVEAFEKIVKKFENSENFGNIQQSNSNLWMAIIFGLIFIGAVIAMGVSISQQPGTKLEKFIYHIPDIGFLLILLGFIVVNSMRASPLLEQNHPNLTLSKSTLIYACLSGAFALVVLISSIVRKTPVAGIIFVFLWVLMAGWFGSIYRTYNYYENNPVDEVDIPEDEIA